MQNNYSSLHIYVGTVFLTLSVAELKAQNGAQGLENKMRTKHSSLWNYWTFRSWQ